SEGPAAAASAAAPAGAPALRAPGRDRPPNTPSAAVTRRASAPAPRETRRRPTAAETAPALRRIGEPSSGSTPLGTSLCGNAADLGGDEALSAPGETAGRNETRDERTRDGFRNGERGGELGIGEPEDRRLDGEHRFSSEIAAARLGFRHCGPHRNGRRRGH